MNIKPFINSRHVSKPGILRINCIILKMQYSGHKKCEISHNLLVPASWYVSIENVKKIWSILEWLMYSTNVINHKINDTHF